MNQFIIKRLDHTDVEDFRQIRLAALAKSPTMFGAHYAVESVKPLDFFIQRLSASFVFGAYQAQTIIGLAVLTPESGMKTQHKAHLTALFVEPEFRRKSVAEQLLSFLMDYSQQNLEQIMLSVFEDNRAAINLYKKYGFEIYGIEQQSVKDQGCYRNEVLMKFFTPFRGIQ